MPVVVNSHIFNAPNSVYTQDLSAGSGIEFTSIYYMTFCTLTYQLQVSDGDTGTFATVRECTFAAKGTLSNGKCPEWPQASNPLTTRNYFEVAFDNVPPTATFQLGGLQVPHEPRCEEP